MDYIEHAQVKHGCYNRAQEITTALSLCSSKTEMKMVLEDIGFRRVAFISNTPHIAAERGEWSVDDAEHNRAIYLSPFYGVVRVVDYMHKHINATAVLEEQTARILAALEHDERDNIKVKGTELK